MKPLSLITIALLTSATIFTAKGDCHSGEYEVVPVIDFEQEPNPYGYDIAEGIAVSPRGNLFVGTNIAGYI